jgi:hypothetical protein
VLDFDVHHGDFIAPRRASKTVTPCLTDPR